MKNIIKTLVQQYGENILLDSSRLKSLIADTLQNKDYQTLRRFELAINNNVPQELYALKDEKDEKRILRINVILANLDDLGIKKEIAFKVVDCFAEALGFNSSILSNNEEKKPPSEKRRGKAEKCPTTPNSLNSLSKEDEKLLMEIPLQIAVEIGSARKNVKEILGLTVGSIIELDKEAGAPVDVVINGNLIARGDVVVIDDNFAVRLTEIIKSKFMESLGKS